MVDTREDYSTLQDLYVPIAVGVVVVFLAIVAFAALRYRASRHPEASQRLERDRVEGAYAVLLACVAGFLIYMTLHIETRVDRVSAHPGLRVHVVGARWSWRFEYPDQGVASQAAPGAPSTLVVPVDTTVRFTGTSEDVIHSFWVPARRFKRDVFPHGTTRWDLRWPDVGWDDGGECGEFCGLNHAQMRFSVRVVTRPAFDRWVREKRLEQGA